MNISCYVQRSDDKWYPISPCTINFYHDPEPKSGGHDHNDTTRSGPRQRVGKTYPSFSRLQAPRGTYGTDTDGDEVFITRYEAVNGFVTIYVEASGIGQNESVRVCPVPEGIPGGQRCDSFDVTVRYFDSVISAYSENSQTMKFIGATPTHRSNHYGTEKPKTAITNIAQQYHDEFSCYTQDAPDGSYLRYQRIGINDMSLPYGGHFDLYRNDCPTPTNPAPVKIPSRAAPRITGNGCRDI